MKNKKKFQVPYIQKGDAYSVYSKYKDFIKEIYFAPDINVTPSGRQMSSHTDINDLYKLCIWCHSNDIDTMMLFNSSNIIYTDDKLAQIYNYISTMCLYNLTGVVVANPILGNWIKSKFPNLKIRLSVLSFADNEFKLKDLAKSKIFDSVCLPQSYLRNLNYLKQLKENVDLDLSIIINSGCRPHCALWGWHHNLHNALSANGCCSIITDNFGNLTNKLSNNLFKSPWLLPDMLDYYDNIITQFKVEDRVCTSEQLDSYLSFYTGLNNDYPEKLDQLIHFSCVTDDLKVKDLPLIQQWRLKILNCNYKCDKCNLCERMLKDAKQEKANNTTEALQ